MDEAVIQTVAQTVEISSDFLGEREREYFSLIEKRFPTFSTDTWGLHSQEGVVLYVMSTAIRPSLMIEIGTCGGFSTSFLIGGKRHQEYAAESILLHTFDLNECCPSLPDKPIGFALDILVPEMSKTVAIHTGQTSADLSKYCAPNSVQLAFIDADHCHPGPFLDLLRLIPFLTSDAWIIFHDVNLPAMLFQRKTIPTFNHGAKWLYQHWKGKKFISGGDTENVGVIQMPPEKETLFQTLDILSRLPPETPRHVPMLEIAKEELQKLKDLEEPLTESKIS